LNYSKKYHNNMSKLLQALIISCLTLSIFSCQEDASDKTPKPLPPEVANLDVSIFYLRKTACLILKN
jgi:hypothetical protein